MLSARSKYCLTALVMLVATCDAAAAQVGDNVKWTMKRCSGVGDLVCDPEVPILSLTLKRTVIGEAAGSATLDYVTVSRTNGAEMIATPGLIGAPIAVPAGASLSDDVMAFVRSDALSIFVSPASFDECVASNAENCNALHTLIPYLSGAWKVSKVGAVANRWAVEFTAPNMPPMNGALIATRNDYRLEMSGTRRTNNTELIPDVSIVEELRFNFRMERQWISVDAPR